MNYIWELAIKAIAQEIDPDSITFRYGRPFSGYMELSFVDMNETKVLPVVEINPYYRFYHIFKELFDPDVDENPELVEVIHDLAIHHLKDIDVLMGMNKREYYIEFVIQDILEEGLYGRYLQEKFGLFTRGEQKIVASNLLALHETAEPIYLLKNTIRAIFPNAYVFSNAEEKDEVILFLRTKETKEKAEKAAAIIYLFLPFRYNVEIYWEYIFGIIDADQFMVIDSILIY